MSGLSTDQLWLLKSFQTTSPATHAIARVAATSRPMKTPSSAVMHRILTTRHAYAVPVSSGVRLLVIKTTSGLERPEATNQAFTVAAAAVAAGADVSLWLTGESAWFALPGRAADLDLPHATPLADLLEVILEGGAV